MRLVLDYLVSGVQPISVEFYVTKVVTLICLMLDSLMANDISKSALQLMLSSSSKCVVRWVKSRTLVEQKP